MTLAYFGDISGKRIVDFGCGAGEFLGQCLESGAEFGLGIDVNRAMMDANAKSKSFLETQLRFLKADLFQPLPNLDVGQFDLPSAQYVIHSCDNEQKLATFAKNILSLLKPHGKLFICQCPATRTEADRERFAVTFGMSPPIRSDQGDRDPFFAEYQAYKRAKDGTFTRKPAFEFSDWIWSADKIIEAFRKVGFENVRAWKPSELGCVHEVEDELTLAEELEEPLIYIGAEKS